MSSSIIQHYIPTINGIKQFLSEVFISDPLANGDAPKVVQFEFDKDGLAKPIFKSNPVPKLSGSFHSRWYWPFATWMILTEVLAVYALLFVRLRILTGLFAFLYGVLSGVCITAGYHRLWSHRAYKASWLLELFFAVFSTSSTQSTIIWWVQNHRLHHRYTDTERDPYNIKQGFWHAHIGWLFFKRKEADFGYCDMTDMYTNKIVLWQCKYYIPISIFTVVLIPTTFCGVCFGDWAGGFFWASMARLVVVQHLTFCVNSVAHTFGSQPYSNEQSSRDSWITGIITLGEGYHNFHHAFPNDYRSGYRWYDLDLTKWVIWWLDQFGLAMELKRFPRNEIMKSRAAMMLQRVKKLANKLDYGPSTESLPKFTVSEFIAEVRERGRKWLVIEGFIYDIEEFVNMHPGGAKIIMTGIGKDMTNAFNGGVYYHHYSARSLMNSTMRVGRII